MVSPKVRITVLAAVLAGLIATVVICRAENFTDLKPSPQALEWQDLEFGVFGIDRLPGALPSAPNILCRVLHEEIHCLDGRVKSHKSISR